MSAAESARSKPNPKRYKQFKQHKQLL